MFGYLGESKVLAVQFFSQEFSFSFRLHYFELVLLQPNPRKITPGQYPKSFIRGRSHPRSNQLLDTIFDSKGALSSFVRLLLANGSPWDANAEAHQNDAFSRPPPLPPLPLVHSCINAINIAWGEGDSRNRLLQQHSQILLRGRIRVNLAKYSSVSCAPDSPCPFCPLLFLTPASLSCGSTLFLV